MKKRARGVNGRVREEAGAEAYGAKTKQTSNAERRTSNVELRGTASHQRQEASYDLEERLLEYAVRIIRLVDALPATKAGRHVADQLLRCGTSPLANHGELQGAESRKDFIHKLGICLKEIREAQRWLRLNLRGAAGSASQDSTALAETDALIRIFVASLRTAEKNR
jgi:four helix bundle protein